MVAQDRVNPLGGGEFAQDRGDIGNPDGLRDKPMPGRVIPQKHDQIGSKRICPSDNLPDTAQSNIGFAHMQVGNHCNAQALGLGPVGR